jgi:hypothetical protein
VGVADPAPAGVGLAEAEPAGVGLDAEPAGVGLDAMRCSGDKIVAPLLHPVNVTAAANKTDRQRLHSSRYPYPAVADMATRLARRSLGACAGSTVQCHESLVC